MWSIREKYLTFSLDLSEETREKWESFVSGTLAEVNKQNTVDLVSDSSITCNETQADQLPDRSRQGASRPSPPKPPPDRDLPGREEPEASSGQEPALRMPAFGVPLKGDLQEGPEWTSTPAPALRDTSLGGASLGARSLGAGSLGARSLNGTGLPIGMEATTLAASPGEDNWWMAPIIRCPCPALVPAGYAESDVMYGARVDFNRPGETFGFAYYAFREWQLTVTQAGVLPPVVLGAGPVPEAQGFNIRPVGNELTYRQGGPGAYFFRMVLQAQYTQMEEGDHTAWAEAGGGWDGGGTRELRPGGNWRRSTRD